MKLKCEEPSRPLVRLAGLVLLAGVTLHFAGARGTSPSSIFTSTSMSSGSAVRVQPYRYEPIRAKPKHRGASWTALDGILSCPTKESAVKLARLIIEAKHDWRLVDEVRVMVGTDEAESDCGRIEKIRFDFAEIEFISKFYDERELSALVFRAKPRSGLSLKDRVDQQIEAMKSDDSPDPEDGYYIITRPKLVEWVLQPGTKVN